MHFVYAYSYNSISKNDAAVPYHRDGSFLFFIPLLLGILAIFFRKIAKKKGANDGMMTAGLICGIIGIAISVIGFMFTILTVLGLIESLDEFSGGGTTLIL